MSDPFVYAILGAVRQNEDMMYDERERVLFFASAMHNDMAAVSATTERSVYSYSESSNSLIFDSCIPAYKFMTYKVRNRF